VLKPSLLLPFHLYVDNERKAIDNLVVDFWQKEAHTAIDGVVAEFEIGAYGRHLAEQNDQ
jgi:hypothetical protein